MSRGPSWRVALATGLLLACPGAASFGQGPDQPPPPVPFDPNAPQGQVPPPIDPNGPQILARGPIHEAFASPISFNPAPGPVVPKPPPQTQIEEQPPDQKPQGADVEWIPGYWAWDDERNDYIWVSGVWRDIPPGRQWVPGYWSQADGGFRWTPGFWGSSGAAANGQFYYLPAPPQSLENGPNSPQPGPNFAWAPGNWLWQADHYVWKPGYWFQSSPDWIWTPSSYTSTPSGYVYNDGFWDYSMNRRGLAFAPTYFGASIYSQPNYAYSPAYALPVAGLLSTLFVRPSYNSYYFGNYYGGSGGGGFGGGGGYVPWFDYNRGRGGYDPLYASMAASNAGNPGWSRQIREDYQVRVNNVAARPASTFAAQRAGGLALAQPLRQWAANPEANHRLVPVAQDHRAELVRRQASVNEFAQARQRQEFEGRDGIGPRGPINEPRGPINEPRGPINEPRGVGIEARRVENQPRVEQARAEQFHPQRMELPRSPIASAREPRFQSPGLGVPPAHPEGHVNSRPNFEGVPNRPMNTGQGRAEPRPAAPREGRPGRPR